MKTWLQSAATSAKFTGLLCFAAAAAITLWHVGVWLVAVVGIVPTVMLLTSIVFAVLTVFVRIGSRVREQAVAEQQAYADAIKARRAEIDAKIQYAQTLAQQASQWRPNAPLH